MRCAAQSEPLDFEDYQDALYGSGSFTIDPNYVLNADTMPKPLPPMAHCDCEGANAASGRFRRGSGPAMLQVPVTANDCCVHCGHTVLYRPMERANKNYGTSYGSRESTYGIGKPKRPVNPAFVALPDKLLKKPSSKPKEMPNSNIILVAGGVKGAI